MEEKQAAAAALHNSGFNCAASVLSVFCESYGLPPEMARALTGGFGAGMKAGQVCGAASAAVMVIGLKHGQRRGGDSAAKQACYAHTQAFMHDFEQRFGSLLCPKLLAAQKDTPEAKNEGLKNAVCNKLIAGSIEMLEQRGY